ncbi:serine hydrolase domain-containing protein [Nocardioides yefusunii]|uniref:Serine hydrolase domain-containing protein n=1 Tax=Nocardioides yefusunii TaxID=2500546 RepID=A0ABW1QYN3_9ACTN|nr:serine hydrolase [Nocardioides yefusunii]
MTDQELHRPRRSRWKRVAVAVPVTLAVLVGGAYVATTIADVPPPHQLAKTATAKPSEWGELFDYRTVTAGAPRPLTATPVDLPTQVPWKGKQVDLAEFLDTTHTNSLVVLHDGELVHEWYADGFDAGTLQPSFSVAKSVVSLLVGQAIGRGELSEDDLLVDVLPDLRTGGDYDKITVAHLLDMSAGVDVSEVYNEMWPFTGTSLMFLTRDLEKFVADRTEVDRTPGEKADYRSVETMLLGLVLEKATGKNLSTLLSEGIWTPTGAEADARWSLDAADTDDRAGVEKAFAGINATARDFARVGQLVVDGGEADGEQVLPAEWIDRISTSAVVMEAYDQGYSAQWWHPWTDREDFTAIGIYGQYVYVDPASRTVVVKLSDHGTEQDEDETLDVLRDVAQHVSR